MSSHPSSKSTMSDSQRYLNVENILVFPDLDSLFLKFSSLFLKQICASLLEKYLLEITLFYKE